MKPKNEMEGAREMSSDTGTKTHSYIIQSIIKPDISEIQLLDFSHSGVKPITQVNGGKIMKSPLFRLI